MPSGQPPVGWGEPEVMPGIVDTAGNRLAIDVLAKRILGGVIDQFGAASIGLPERVFVAAGPPRNVPWDCEQLTIATAGIGWGPAVTASGILDARVGTEMGANALRHVMYEIELVRQVPAATLLSAQGSAPNLAAMDDFGMAVMRDCGVLSQAMTTMFGPDPVTRIVPVGSRAQPGIAQIMGPSGDYIGVSTSVAVTIGETA